MIEPLIPHFISVILPAHNEQDCIGKSVGDAVAYLSSAFRDYEVVVVNDGSRDRTPDIVRDIAATNPKVRLITLPTNEGYGSALAKGFKNARGDLVFFTDADNQFDIRELSDLIPLLAQADAVFGFRIYRYDSVLRCILSWVYNRLVRILFRVKVRDVDCSFKLFTRPVVDQLVIESRDFFVDTEMVARTARMGFRIVEKGVRHYPRMAGHTTVRTSDIPRTLKTVARMWFRIHYPPKQDAVQKIAETQPSEPR
jgi:glycosyltransferase involved in cell wall biosynthesis